MITLIDKSNILYISFFMSLREMKEIKGSDEIERSDYPFFVHSLINTFQSYFIKYKNIYLCEEGLNSTEWRRSIFPDYKANRSDFKASLNYEHFRNIIKMTNEFFTYMPCKIVNVENAEADDVIYALSEKYKKVLIISSDKDLAQIPNKFPEVELFNPIKKKFVTPHEFIIEEKAIIGDKSDNIPGIPGIGEKTFFRMLEDEEFFNKKMMNGNREIYERFLKIVDLSKCPFIEKIKEKEEEIPFNKFDSESIQVYLMKNKLVDLLARWPSIEGKIYTKLTEE